MLCRRVSGHILARSTPTPQELCVSWSALEAEGVVGLTGKHELADSGREAAEEGVEGLHDMNSLASVFSHLSPAICSR